MVRPIALALWLLFLRSGIARADDWLAVLPDCGERTAPGVALAYPRAGLPALVHAGSVLVVYVTQPTALTPPPGVQQPRALAGWSAALTPRVLAVPDTPQTAREASERVAVIDVRPDGPSSLRYRAKLALPPWLAPASYDLRLTSPGGTVALAAAVRILVPGAAPRLARAQAPRLGMPFDAVVATESQVPSSRGPLTLVPAQAVAALRVGDRLWTLGECRGEGASLAARARRVQGDAELGAPPIATPVVLDAPVRVTQRQGVLSIEAAAALGGAAELELLADGRRAVRVEGARVEWFPLGNGPDAVVGRLHVAPGARASVRYATAASRPLAASLRIPARAKVGALVRLAVDDPPEGARVVWRLGEGERRFGPAHAEHAFRRSGPVDVRAVVVAADGRVRPLEGRLQVTGPGGCQGAGCGFALSLALLASKTRRRRRAGIDCRPPIV